MSPRTARSFHAVDVQLPDPESAKSKMKERGAKQQAQFAQVLGNSTNGCTLSVVVDGKTLMFTLAPDRFWWLLRSACDFAKDFAETEQG